MDIDTTNPADGAGTSAEDVAAAATEVDREPEPQPGGDPGSPAFAGAGESGAGGDLVDPPGNEEIELEDGLKLTLPKDQAQKLRDGWLRQTDYARRTQALSEERRAVEAERAAVRKASQQELSAYAEATSSGTRINELDRAAAGFGGWAAWARQDPLAASQAHLARSELERARNAALGQLHQFRGQRLSAAQQETARRIEETRRTLEQDREIGGWDDHKAAEMLAGGVREYGFDRSEIEELSDARMVKVLHDGLKWRAHLSKQQQAQRHIQAQQAQPAASVGARAAPAAGLDDRLGTEEWVRRRNAQLRKRG